MQLSCKVRLLGRHNGVPLATPQIKKKWRGSFYLFKTSTEKVLKDIFWYLKRPSTSQKKSFLNNTIFQILKSTLLYNICCVSIFFACPHVPCACWLSEIRRGNQILGKWSHTYSYTDIYIYRQLKIKYKRRLKGAGHGDTHL